MWRNFRLFTRLVLIFLFLWTLLIPEKGSYAGTLLQESEQKNQALELLEEMTPEEKIGQLVIVTFKGTDISANTAINKLITQHHVGGVVLSSANDNFVGPDNTIEQAYQLIKNLQTINYQTTQDAAANLGTGNENVPSYVPLFIGLSQEGGSYPHDQILSGLTQLPNLMALGATWNPNLSFETGQILGKELEALGVNLLIGPSLDVLDLISTETADDLGTRTFGGDPYWVGLLGKEYIKGVHQGSSNRIAVVSKFFPGRGGSDRKPEDEVATVRKSLEQLKQIELAPFFAVTGRSESVDGKTDGLLISHTRYQGFQGNIRATTRPVSLDPSALELLMNLSSFQSWRESAGILMSDNLGSQALRRFYDPTGRTFNGRQVARDAFLAGNDLLYLDNFVGSDDPDSYTTIIKTLEFFGQKYREDPAFSRRVDKSVERLLTLKFKQYTEFVLEQVIPAEESLVGIGLSQSLVMEIAQEAATLISPNQEELRTNIPIPPALRDNIIFFTDELSSRQCSQCLLQEVFPVDGMEKAVMRLYGPGSGGQVVDYRLSSYSFRDLLAYLNGAQDQGSTLGQDITAPGWIVFNFRTVDSTRPESRVLKRLINERPDLIQNKQIIAFAFNSPYYIDATDISKLSAYYGLYSHTREFVDVASRLLFQEITATGASPVSIPGVGYDLISATSPNPSQIISLSVELPSGALISEPDPLQTPTIDPLPVPTLSAGEMIEVQTGTIFDKNNNPVPDGTVVRFLFNYIGDTGTDQISEATTNYGIAKINYEIRPYGLLEIRAVSDPATISEVIQLNIASGEVISLTELPPSTPVPIEETPVPSPTVTSTPELTLDETISTDTSHALKPQDWIVSMIVSWGGAGVVFLFGRKRISTRWGVRWGLLAALGGVITFIFLESLLSSNRETLDALSTSGMVFLIMAGVLLGWLGGWIWHTWRYRRSS